MNEPGNKAVTWDFIYEGQSMSCFSKKEKPPLIVIAGPTAVGKSHRAVEMAAKYDGEIISADSMQVYRYMDIGTAKITKNEMQGIPHHLIDIKDPDEEYDIYTFQQDAKSAIDDILNRGKLPIICGGTGFYIQAVTKDINFAVKTDDEYKAKLEEILEDKGEAYLYDILKKCDPEYAGSVHPNNVRRVINAISYFNRTGEKLSGHNETQFQKESPYNLKYFVISCDRQEMYDRINRRVDMMIDSGFEEEVRNLRKMGYASSLKSMQGLGYKELNDYIDQKTSLVKCIEDIKQNTRHFAKRQITWFKREREAVWIDRSAKEILL